MVDFSDLDDLDTAPVRGPSRDTEQVSQTIRCTKCNGTGNTRWGACFRCKGTGQMRLDYQKRRDAYQKGERTKAQRQRTGTGPKADQWREANPKEAAWIDAAADRGFNFASSMREALGRWGSLTDGQMAAVRKLMAQDADRSAQQAERAVELGGAETIRAALVRAVENGLKKPKLRCGAVRFDWPRPGTKNPGCIYVVEANSDSYLGKITPAGVFEPTFRCTEEQRAAVMDVAADPLSAAVAHGKQTGACACCGRELSDPESVARGIGPVCAEKFFGG